MAHDVAGIRFRRCGKVYDFELNGMEVAVGDIVVVESDFGLNLGSVAVARHTVEFEEGKERELKKILRKATQEDLDSKKGNRELEEEAFNFCNERIMARGLPMKLIRTETTLDRKRIIFYFGAEKRIDFRELVKDLAQKFRTRIELRQIGVRDKARLLGGIGICGREVCCRTFLVNFEPISIKMAKKQDLVLNANKLSGACGRLMCCLSYEYGSAGQRYEAEVTIEPETPEEMEAAEEIVLTDTEEEAVHMVAEETTAEPAETTQGTGPSERTERADTGESHPGRRRGRRSRRRGKRPHPGHSQQGEGERQAAGERQATADKQSTAEAPSTGEQRPPRQEVSAQPSAAPPHGEGPHKKRRRRGRRSGRKPQKAAE